MSIVVSDDIQVKLPDKPPAVICYTPIKIERIGRKRGSSVASCEYWEEDRPDIRTNVFIDGQSPTKAKNALLKFISKKGKLEIKEKCITLEERTARETQEPVAT